MAAAKQQGRTRKGPAAASNTVDLDSFGVELEVTLAGQTYRAVEPTRKTRARILAAIDELGELPAAPDEPDDDATDEELERYRKDRAAHAAESFAYMDRLAHAQWRHILFRKDDGEPVTVDALGEVPDRALAELERRLRMSDQLPGGDGDGPPTRSS